MFQVFPPHLHAPPEESKPKIGLARLLPLTLGLSLVCFPVVFAGEGGKGQPKTASGHAHEKVESKPESAKDSHPARDELERTPSPTNYVATAYSLRGKTASGQMVSRGIIAADPRILPLGSRVRLEVPGYHGEYLVADTGGMIRGRRIDIWIPTSREAMKFGSRTVKLTVLSAPNRSPVIMRERLEEQYQAKKISNAEYKTLYAQWAKLVDQEAKASAKYYADRPDLYRSAKYMPAKFGPANPNQKTLLDTQHERFRLEMDLIKNRLTPDEYVERLSAILADEDLVAKNGALTPSEVAHYYQTVAKIQPTLAALRTRNWQTDIQVGLIVITMLGLSLKLYLGYKKDHRERGALDLEKRKLVLAERASLLQLEEMRLKIAQLEQQRLPAPKRLILP